MVHAHAGVRGQRAGKEAGGQRRHGGVELHGIDPLEGAVLERLRQAAASRSERGAGCWRSA